MPFLRSEPSQGPSEPLVGQGWMHEAGAHHPPVWTRSAPVPAGVGPAGCCWPATFRCHDSEVPDVAGETWSGQAGELRAHHLRCGQGAATAPQQFGRGMGGLGQGGPGQGGLGRGGLGQSSAVQELRALFLGAERLRQPWGPGSSTLPGALWPRALLIAPEAIKAFLRNPSCLGSRGTAGRGSCARLPGRKSAAIAPRPQRTPWNAALEALPLHAACAAGRKRCAAPGCPGGFTWHPE